MTLVFHFPPDFRTLITIRQNQLDYTPLLFSFIAVEYQIGILPNKWIFLQALKTDAD